jgi:hypothetical protein
MLEKLRIILNIIVEKYDGRVWVSRNNSYDICHLILTLKIGILHRFLYI